MKIYQMSEKKKRTYKAVGIFYAGVCRGSGGKTLALRESAV